MDDPVKCTKVEEFRGSKESPWSWNTRRKFLLCHYDKPEGLDMINCYSWILINNKSLGCRYETAHMEKLNRMAAEAFILEDLEKGGPTPVIQPYAAASGRGRGKNRGNKENAGFVDGEMNGNGFLSGGFLDSRQALDAQIATCMSSSSMENAGLDGSPVPASSFFTKDYVKPPAINPASFGRLSGSSPGRDTEALTPDEEVAQLTRSDGEESDVDNGVVLPGSLNIYGRSDSDYYFDASMLSSELIASEVEQPEIERPPSHPEVLARSLSDAEDEMAQNFKEENIPEDVLKTVESLVGPASDNLPSSSKKLEPRTVIETDKKDDGVGRLHISGSQLAELTQIAPRNALLAGLFSTMKKPEMPAQDMVYSRYSEPQEPVFNDPAIVFAKPASRTAQPKENNLDLEGATLAIKKMLLLPGGGNRPQSGADSVLPAFPVHSSVASVSSRAPLVPPRGNHRQSPSVAQNKRCDSSVIRIPQCSSSGDFHNESYSQALSFLETRPENEIVVRLRGELVNDEAMRLMSETISVNRAQKLITILSIQVNRNGRCIHEVKISYAGKQLCVRQASSLKDAKNAAAMECLILLMKRFPTIKVSASENAFVQPVAREDLLSGRTVDTILERIEADSESHGVVGSKRSIGWKLMEKMGWKEGKGLGKKEDGIVHPIDCNISASYSVYGRWGVGYRDSDLDYRLILDRADTLFQCFIANAIVLDDLVFAKDFSPREREVIHNAAEKYGLSHNSLGSGDNRHLVVRYKFSLQQLVEELRRVGGHTERYKLVEPPSFYSSLK
ncbi:uncharacterized protein LOC129586404 isoform X2 [Paramacrobiotus metropolitanus]|uniref:uncharacterized protein LOC129586404 isoform X2 n=1 Tax=Paramacrobiotus metropolitanus TaxID=2943436 RepID=UPI002445EEFC|nr:uncharacterized protein LOC129586404 isoform X2 [Paramacrobiotus metropolitanus]